MANSETAILAGGCFWGMQELIRKKPEIDSWFDRRYLNAALKELKLEAYWPVYGANGDLATAP